MDPSMSDDDLRPVVDEVRKFEGLVLHLYNVANDDGTPGVTVGVGCLMSTAQQAQCLPFRHLSGAPATAQEIADEFARVYHLPLGHAPSFYSGDLYITEADAYALAFAVLRFALDDLLHTFPAWPSFPLGPRQCLLDLRWNCGSLRSGGWPHLLAACNAVPPDWQGAADNCTTANPRQLPARAARNAWRRARMLSAVALPATS